MPVWNRTLAICGGHSGELCVSKNNLNMSSRAPDSRSPSRRLHQLVLRKSPAVAAEPPVLVAACRQDPVWAPQELPAIAAAARQARCPERQDREQQLYLLQPETLPRGTEQCRPTQLVKEWPTTIILARPVPAEWALVPLALQELIPAARAAAAVLDINTGDSMTFLTP
jgi:hypothetical protein